MYGKPFSFLLYANANSNNNPSIPSSCFDDVKANRHLFF